MKQIGKNGILKKPSVPVVVALLLLAVLLVSGGITLAKYVTQRQEDTTAYIPETFYFESDLLATNTPGYNIYGTSVTFELRNYADAERVSPDDIHYVYSLNGETKGEGRFTGGTMDKETITLTGLTPGTTYTVAATTTKAQDGDSPYEQTISATITIPAENNAVTASLAQDSSANVVYVTVSTTDYSGAITLNWATTLLPDNTDPLLAGATGNSCSVTLGEYSSHVFTFIKKSSSTSHSCSVSGTTVTIN